MKPEDLVPTRSTCIALKEAGFPQDTHFGWWRFPGNPEGTFFAYPMNLVTANEWKERGGVAAPTLGEILEQLREHSAQVGWSRPGQVSPDGVWHAFRPGDELTLQFHENPAEAAARLWIKVNGGVK